MHNIIWKNCLEYISKRIPAQSFVTWFLPIKPLKTEGNVLTIQVPSKFVYEWIEAEYIAVIGQAISKAMGSDARLEYSVVAEDNDTQENSAPVAKITSVSEPSKGTNQPSDPILVNELEIDSSLDPTNLFDNYIEGDCNRLARSAGMAVAKNPGGTSFNPLMIYGGVGLGKTHLVQAIGNEISQKDTSKKIVYAASEKFTSQFIDSLRNNNVHHFISYYQKVDVLILDDVQFLKKKEKTQEIFYHIFNHLRPLGKQIIMTSDRAPKDLEGLQDRLVSRFNGGLTADLQQPSFEMRIAIIKNKIKEEGIHIPIQVLEYIAHTVDTNIRDLEGVMLTLTAHASLTKTDINLELAKEILKNLVKEIDSEVGIDYIQKIVASYFHVEQKDLKAKTKKREIVLARQVAMYFSRKYTNHSQKHIGQFFGGRDHSTVIHALQTVDNMLDTNAKFQYSIDELNKKLKM